MGVREQDWRLAAACRSTDPDLFFPISSSGRSLEMVARAKEICASCQVRFECLTFALRTHQAYGVWGGMSEEERSLIQTVLRWHPSGWEDRPRANPGAIAR